MHQEMIKNSLLKEKLALNDRAINKPPTPEATVPVVTKATHSQMHWSTYKQDPIPEYIIEAKKRLGQIKEPFSNIDTNSKTPKISITPDKPSNSPIQKHWSQMENPSTPDHIKNIRKRLGDDRYRRTELTKSKSFTNAKTYASSNGSAGGGDAEVYKIPTFLSVNTNVNITTSENPVQQNVDTLVMESSYTNFLPVTEQEVIQNEIDHALYIAKNYEDTHPIQDRLLNSRASNNTRTEFSPTDSKNMIPLDTWLKSHSNEQEKDSVLRALKHTGSASCASPTTSIQFKHPLYLHSSYANESHKNQYNEFVRMAVKNPSPPKSSAKRRTGTPTMRVLGQARGTHMHPELSIENEKNFIRDYLWNANR